MDDFNDFAYIQRIKYKCILCYKDSGMNQKYELVQHSISFRKDQKDFIKARGLSIQDFVRSAVDERIDKIRERETKKAS